MPGTLVGEFVNLRPLASDDAEVTFRWRQGQRAILLNRGAQSVEEQGRWIASRPSSEYNFIIETKAHCPMGMLSLTDIDPVNRRGEPGRFLIGDEAAAQGIPAAVEAMKLLYELAFGRLRLLRVYGAVAADNVRMIKWQKYLGMVQEGLLRQHYFINGRFQDAVFFGLLESEYRGVTLPRLDALIAAARMRVAGSNQAE
jgi:RimJ/RimL family protein N-acetyltransferase